ncbi:putative isoleucine--tRNA ligase, cytoplasmic, partial [Nosema granulosis]
NSTVYNPLVLDDWIKNSFNSFLEKVTETMEKYELSKVLNLALKFVDDLSNWYIRIHRKEIKDGSSGVLGDLLSRFSIVMAPFTPFFSEYCYQSISKNGSLSVHFEMYPKKFITEEDDFEYSKEVIEAVRSIREQKQISLKTPLCEATIYCSEEFKKTISRYIDTILQECNILKLTFKEEDSISVKLSVKPFFENLRKDRSTMKLKMEAIRKLSEEEVEDLLQGSISSNGVVLSKEDVLVEKELVGDNSGLSKVHRLFIVSVDDTLTEEVVEIRDAREFNSFIQQLRKKLGLKVEDNVNIYIEDSLEDESSKLKEICRKHFDIIFGNEGEYCGEGIYSYKKIEYKVIVKKK